MWQAARGGLSGVLLDDTRHPKPLPAAQAVKALVKRLRPQLEELGDWAEVRELAKTTLARGNSADRQRAAYAERGRLSDVVELVVQETHGPPGGPEPAVPALRRYRYRAGDEAVGPSHRPRPIYHDLIDYFRSLGDRQSARAQAGPGGLGRPARHDVRGRGREAAVLGRPDAAADQPARVAGPGRRA